MCLLEHFTLVTVLPLGRISGKSSRNLRLNREKRDIYIYISSHTHGISYIYNIHIKIYISYIYTHHTHIKIYTHIYYFHVYGCFAYMYYLCTTWLPSAYRSQKVSDAPATGVTGGCDYHLSTWKLNPGPPEEKQMLLAAEPSLKPLDLWLLLLMCMSMCK